MVDVPAVPDPSPSEPDIDENGVDLTQIREMLDRTPAERLALATEFMSALIAIRVRNGYPGAG